MKRVYAYIRVSTVRQGEKGSSLQEQKDAILAYARRHELEIVSWFEEMETAAKGGRQEFNRMLNLLRRGKAGGVVLHKIDRGARNLMDWARLCELSDRGLAVHSVSENVDLLSTHGRLSADIQAAVAASYVRNLREEVMKGLYGRLKQGIYPLAAPIGYIDTGGGNPKEIDPLSGPLMKRAFERYATGSVSLDALAKEMNRLGLRTKRGGLLTRGRLSTAFSNPFYIGLMRVKRNEQTYQGVHKPLMSKSLFDRVQRVLSGKANKKVRKHQFLFQRLMRCRGCHSLLSGELQKGRVYYRCHAEACRGGGMREDQVERIILSMLGQIPFAADELAGLKRLLEAASRDESQEKERQKKAIDLALVKLSDRLNRLTDAFIDQLIDAELFEGRKRALLLERAALAESAQNAADSRSIADQMTEFFELSETLPLTYENGLAPEKREILESVVSNFEVYRKDVVVRLRSPYREVFESHNVLQCGHHRARFRTLTTQKLFDLLWKHFSNDNRSDETKEVA